MKIRRHGCVKEANLPENTDPLDPKIEDPEERSRMIRTFARGLTKAVRLRPAGAALECAGRSAGHRGAARWKSEKWKLRRGNLFLFPAIRRSATGCRCRRCPGCRNRPIRISSIKTR